MDENKTAKTPALLITLLILLASIVAFVYFNPTAKMAQARNETRVEDLEEIVNSITKYAVENNGTLPAGIPVSEQCEMDAYEICRTSASSCEGKVVLSDLTKEDKYLKSIPSDPKSKSNSGTGYNIVQNESGRITLCAPLAELSVDIKYTR